MEKLFIDNWFKTPPKKDLERKYTFIISERKAGLKNAKLHKKTTKTKAKKRG